MGCSISKEKIECNMLALKLKRIEIRIAKDKEMEKYKQIAGEDLERDTIPDYIDLNSLVKMKAKRNERNDNNKNDLTCDSLKRNSKSQGTFTRRSTMKSKSQSKGLWQNNKASPDRMNPMPIILKGNECDRKKIKLKRIRTVRSMKKIKLNERELDRNKTMNPIRMYNKSNSTNRDFYPIDNLLHNDKKGNENYQYLKSLRDSKPENEKVSEFKSRRKEAQYEDLYNNNDKITIKQLRINDTAKEVFFREKSFYKSDPDSDKSNQPQQYERRFTNKLNQYINNKIKPNSDRDRDNHKD